MRKGITEFFRAFWPNLASTVLGVILGVPAGLWLASSGEHAQHKAESGRLTQALQVVSETLSFNREQFKEVLTTLDSSRVPFELTVDYSAWDAVKSEVIPFLHDPQLQRRLAYHFSRTQAVAKLNDLYLNYTSGIGSAIGGSQQTREALRAYLVQTLSALDVEAGQLTEEIKHAKR